LVVRPCVADLSPGSAETGATAAPNSILTLPEASFAELEPVDVTVRQARDISGSLVTFYVFGSDTLFDTGSSQLRSTAQPALAGAVASIRQRFASATIVVRGHTDSTGAAAANVKLSTARAQAVAARLGELGLAGSHLTTVGLGSSVPAALETNPDGSVNDLGRQLNRRVEVVVVQPVP
jgi:outer membrane protein OmpA-like peptidoglycan-associated protein